MTLFVDPNLRALLKDLGGLRRKLSRHANLSGVNFLRLVKDVVAAKNAPSLAGPECDGETVFHQLEIDNKISSRVLKDLWSEELRLFKPEGREGPSGMMVRYDCQNIVYLQCRCRHVRKGKCGSEGIWDSEKGGQLMFIQLLVL
jgi:hypothetical protein